MEKTFIGMLLLAGLCACSSEQNYDATGTFEATEVTISAESTGKIISLSAEEGQTVQMGEILGEIDSTQYCLQRKQLRAQQNAILSSRPDVQKQLAATDEQIIKFKTELSRVENMLKDGAASRKQLDDVQAQLRIAEGQKEALLSTLTSNTSTINSNAAALGAQIDLLSDNIKKCQITSPINGTIISKYSQKGEFTAVARPLFKVADLENMYVRAYFTSEQLSSISLGQEVKVIADYGADEQKKYTGKIVWIASKSEFTPKGIQTKDSRANLVYAVKVAVKNDGLLKIGLSANIIL